MFIELTDHLRCPAEHPEQFLVLLPDRMEGRRVMQGQVGCPVCGKMVQILDGVLDFGEGVYPAGDPGDAGDDPGLDSSFTLSADAAVALLGMEGPGGYLLLVDQAARLAPDLEILLPGVGLVLVNPPPSLEPRLAENGSTTASIIRAPRLPVKAASMRGAVLGGKAARETSWVIAAGGTVLPGLRIVVAGPLLPEMPFEILAESPGCWVGRRT